MDRFNAVFADLPEPDRSRLVLIATVGASIPLPGGFVRLSSPPPLRPLAQSLGNCFLKHAVKLWEGGKVLALPLRSLSTTELQTLHFCPGHWTPKPNVPMGRFLLDATNATNPNNVLNKEDSFIVAENLYGVLKLPSIQTIVTGWVEYVDEHDYSWSEMRIYKEDIRGAFSQVKINPDHATLLAVLMSSNMLMIHLFGVFGWHAMPLVFAVFSRALLWVMAKEVAGVIDIYVDDFMGLSHRLTAQADQYIVQSVCRATFGHDALADDNLVASSVADNSATEST